MTDKPHMSAEEFREIFRLLGLDYSSKVADLFCIARPTLYRYRAGTKPIPAHFATLLRDMLYNRRDPATVMALAYPLSQSRHLP